MNESLLKPVLKDTQIHSNEWYKIQHEIYRMERLGWGKK